MTSKPQSQEQVNRVLAKLQARHEQVRAMPNSHEKLAALHKLQDDYAEIEGVIGHRLDQMRFHERMTRR